MKLSNCLSYAVVSFLLCLTDHGGATTTTAAPCVNTIDTCYHHRKEDICVGIYKPWASARCALYCGFCQGPEVCEDAIPNCYQYQPCDNPTFFVWVADNCRKFCGRCGDVQGTTAYPVTGTTVTQQTPPHGHVTNGVTHTAAVTTQAPVATTHQTVSAVCADSIAFCNTYSLSACTERPQWALDFCPYYCGLCPPGATTQQVTSGPVTTHAVTSGPVTTAAVTSGPLTTAAVTSGPVATTVAVTSGPAVTGEPSSTCKDNVSFCHIYSPEACVDLVWGRKYCLAFCKLC